LTVLREVDKLKFMSRFIFAIMATTAIASAAMAQQVPGRDLLQFPIGSLAEAPPLSREMVGGLWNPGLDPLPAGERLAFGATVLTTPIEQGVQATLIGAAYRMSHGLTGTLSVAQASVGGIIKTTGTDPESLPGEGDVPYSTTIVSAGASRDFGGVTAGLAARYRWGALDTEHRGVGTLDGGVTIDRFLRTPLRIAASTFLLTPGRPQEDATYMIAADLPLLPSDSIRSVRGGYSLQHTDERGHENYAFLSGRFRQFDASAGVLQSSMFGGISWRLRVGLGLHYGRYAVAVAREDGAAGIGASQQFLLTSVFP
jgi:hypothetical protein